MGKTRHFKARMSQRAINEELVELVRGFGVPGPDGKCILNRKGLEALCESLTELHQRAQRALKKGGIVVVEEGNALITTYRLSSYSAPRASAS
jgi:hypothetical protein